MTLPDDFLEQMKRYSRIIEQINGAIAPIALAQARMSEIVSQAIGPQLRLIREANETANRMAAIAIGPYAQLSEAISQAVSQAIRDLQKDCKTQIPEETSAEVETVLTEDFYALSLEEKINFLVQKAKRPDSITRKDAVLLILAVIIDLIINSLLPQICATLKPEATPTETVRQVRKRATTLPCAKHFRIVAKDRLELHARPKGKSPVLAFLPKGKIVWAHEKKGPWCSIGVEGGATGWVRSKYLAEVKRDE